MPFLTESFILATLAFYENQKRPSRTGGRGGRSNDEFDLLY
jgi:hypothetical protein